MPNATLHVGDAKETLRDLPESSVQTCVTSPPYHGLRNYGEDGQLGLEDTPQEYVQNIADVFDEVRRVLRSDGTAWLNLGDAYARPAAKGGSGTPNGRNGRGESYAGMETKISGYLKEKDLKMLPSRVAMELQRRGWWVRSRIVWAKGVSFCDEYSGSCMPESVTDRPTSGHEYIFLLTPSKSYFYDHDAVKEGCADPSRIGEVRGKHDDSRRGQDKANEISDGGGVMRAKRNLRDTWIITPDQFPDAHFAVYPPELIEPCVKAGTSKKGECPECGAPWERVVDHTPGEYEYSERGENAGHDAQASGTQVKPAERKTTGWKPTCECGRDADPQTVLDPFAGAGTTGVVALAKGRDFIGIDLSREYCEMAADRIRQDAPLMNRVEINN